MNPSIMFYAKNYSTGFIFHFFPAMNWIPLSCFISRSCFFCFSRNESQDQLPESFFFLLFFKQLITGIILTRLPAYSRSSRFLQRPLGVRSVIRSTVCHHSLVAFSTCGFCLQYGVPDGMVQRLDGSFAYPFQLHVRQTGRSRV